MSYTIERTREALLYPNRFIGQHLRHGCARCSHTARRRWKRKRDTRCTSPAKWRCSISSPHTAQIQACRALIPTFLGAHALPPEFEREVAFVDYLIDQVIPAAAAHGARYADAFCEPGFFSVEQTSRYLDAARSTVCACGCTATRWRTAARRVA